jgi:hypothetical protein
MAREERARALRVARMSHWRSGWLKLSVNSSATAGFCDIAPSSWSRCGAGGSAIIRLVVGDRVQHPAAGELGGRLVAVEGDRDSLLLQQQSQVQTRDSRSDGRDS